VSKAVKNPGLLSPENAGAPGSARVSSRYLQRRRVCRVPSRLGAELTRRNPRAARPPVDHVDGSLYGTGAEPIQGFLARVSTTQPKEKTWAAKSFRDWPNYVPAAGVAAASHALAGRLEPAGEAVECIRQLDPTFRVSTLGTTRYLFSACGGLGKISGGITKGGPSGIASGGRKAPTPATPAKLPE
jgi:hypothetical protein